MLGSFGEFETESGSKEELVQLVAFCANVRKCFTFPSDSLKFQRPPRSSVLSKQTGVSPSSRQLLMAGRPLTPAPTMHTWRRLASSSDIFSRERNVELIGEEESTKFVRPEEPPAKKEVTLGKRGKHKGEATSDDTTVRRRANAWERARQRCPPGPGAIKEQYTSTAGDKSHVRTYIQTTDRQMHAQCALTFDSGEIEVRLHRTNSYNRFWRAIPLYVRM